MNSSSLAFNFSTPSNQESTIFCTASELESNTSCLTASVSGIKPGSSFVLYKSFPPALIAVESVGSQSTAASILPAMNAGPASLIVILTKLTSSTVILFSSNIFSKNICSKVPTSVATVLPFKSSILLIPSCTTIPSAP